MLCRPASDAVATSFELVQRNLVHARLGIDHSRGSMKARPLHRVNCREAFVEDAGDDAEERGSESRPSSRARRERQTTTVEQIGRASCRERV